MITLDTFKRGLNNGVKNLIELLKLMIPIYIGIELLNISGLLDTIAKLFNPLMSIFGLPGESSLALIIGFFSGIYGAISAIAAIELNHVQITTLAIMVSISHNLIGETAIVKKLGVSALASASLRVFFSFFLGFLYSRIFG